MNKKIALVLRLIAIILIGVSIYKHEWKYFIFAWILYAESNFLVIESKFETIANGLGKFDKAVKDFIR